ncbi:MAG TPA: DegV family protein [Syntrophothermus lipocalidus]|nr:DegV family protein [Syntrophothermus lipocalidus]HOV43743.1 DegV family protein [Syntrophothermus lipocalidus]
MRVKIVTDNCCDLPAELIDRYGIKMVHMLVSFGDRTFQPGELSTNSFYEMMAASHVLPTTSQPTMEEMRSVYEECLADGSEVIAIHLSSGMTGTVQAAEMVRDTLPGRERLTVIDSLKASAGEGLLVLEAARMAESGRARNEIVDEILKLRAKLRCVFTINTLEYLVKGGRVSRAKGLVGSMLDIKPILWVNPQGYIEPIDKVRGRKSAIRRLVRMVEEMGRDLKGQTVGISHAMCPEDAARFSDVFVNEFKAGEVIMGEIGPVVGSHVGPGTLAIFFYGEELGNNNHR